MMFIFELFLPSGINAFLRGVQTANKTRSHLTEHLTRYEPTIFIQLCAAFFKPFFVQLWGGDSHTTYTQKYI